MHAPLLRLPYFWDEAGYFIPAARDLLLTGNPIPTSTLSNAHPPLVMAWLALWWKLSQFTPAVTRTAMLLVAAFALLGVFRLARQVANIQVAAAATLLTALYPVFFAQSSLAHLDLAAAAFTIWGLAAYLRQRRWRAMLFLALAGLAKETAVITPIALAGSELLQWLRSRHSHRYGVIDNGHPVAHPLAALSFVLAVIPLAGWLVYHYAHTGVVFGNPEYFRYNVGATLNPLRVLLALLQRSWQLLGYLNMYVLTVATAFAMRRPPLERNDYQRPRIALNIQYTFGMVTVAYGVMLAVVGGAVLARYLLPVYPLVIIVCVSTLWRRLSWWPVATVIVAVAFVAGLFSSPPYRIAPEDNLTYADYVRLHKKAYSLLRQFPNVRVLTAWPASDELRYPYLGYVSQPVQVVPVEDFTIDHLVQARAQHGGEFNYAVLFSTKYEPDLLLNPSWWEALQRRFFDYHRDAAPQVAAALLGGDIIDSMKKGSQWIAVVAIGGNAPSPVPPPPTR